MWQLYRRINMVNKKQQEKKRKERERTSYAKVMKRRESLRAERKLAKEEDRQRQQIEEMSHGKSQPIIADEQKAAERDAAKSAAVAEQLRKNLEILEALEKEYDEEQQRRVDVNQQLESEGYVSIKEKMDALHKKALEMTGKATELAEAQKEFAEQQEEIVVQPEDIL